MFSLKITSGDQHVRTYEFTKAAVTVGRETENDIVLDDLRVSRHHLLFQAETNTLRVTDLNSGNGTYLNGQRMEIHTARQLQEGDHIKLGSTVIEILDVDTARLTQADQGLQPLLQKLPSSIYETVVSFGDQPAATLTKELLQTELEKKARVLKLFYELSLKLGTVLSEQDIYEHVLTAVLNVTPAVRVVILMKDEDGDFLPTAMRWRPEFPLDSRQLPISQTVLTRVASQRAGLLLAEIGKDAMPYSAHSLLLTGTRSVIASPILASNELVGMIYADLQDALQRFSPDDLELLNTIAIQAGLAVNTAKAHERLQRQAAARMRFERFLPPSVVDAVMRGTGALKLGGVRQDISVLFADIRGFTTLSETQPPEIIVEMLNRYFSLASEIIFQHNGTLDKYIGDGLFAFFGAPYEDPEHPLKAVRAAWELQQALAAFNESLQRDLLPTVSVGIGINTGTALVGYIGSEKRTDYTAIGDTVNTAARLESMAQGGQILVSETTCQLIGKEFDFRSLGSTPLKGKAQPLEIAEVVGFRDPLLHGKTVTH
ncbi:MAG: FHA domain-containing protein [Acidobacteria bacterium]|nr:FHA domain-containing protein [Acidobacteriota bacterium]